MKKTLLGFAALALTAALGQASAAVTLTIACGDVGKELELCKAGVARWAKKTGNTVRVFESPNLTNDRLALYQQQLAAKSSDIDVYQLDVIWPGLLDQHFVDLKGKVPQAAVDQHFKGIIAANTVGNKLVALPWFTDAGLLYYRTDLMKKYGYSKAPATWAEMAVMAKRIQDGERRTNRAFQGFVFQGKDYEGLTCNALEWITSFGGSIVDSTGRVTVNSPANVRALTAAAGWIRSISPADVTTWAEEDARGVFQAGNAAFMRNWPYAWGLGQGDESKIKGNIGVAPLPRGTGAGAKNAATLGGWQLGVSSYGKSQKEAIDLVLYLTGPEEQKIRAVEGSYNPTIERLYRDADVLKANPFFGSLFSVFTNAVPRPSGVTKEKYNQVSQAFSGAFHSALTGRATPTNALRTLETNLNRIRGRGW